MTNHTNTRLFIAEKPSMARLIAAALGGGKPVGQTHISMPSGDIVAWAVGHLLEQADPATYGDQWIKWSLESLPIVPSIWKLNVKKNVKDLYKSLQSLIKAASEVIHAGDADREGQLLVDEILETCGYKGPVKRLIITDTTDEGIKKALSAMTPNKDHQGSRDAALARSRADWLHGMNCTRAFTCLAQKHGYRGNALRIGRVKTPVTALVVRRDLEIEAFQPKPFWVVQAHIETPKGKGNWTANWQPSDDQKGLDAEGRIIDKSVAESCIYHLEKETAHVVSVEKKKKKQAPPLGYSLPALQIDASKRYGFTPQKTLELCQTLYEAQMQTYPRSDCQYAPEAHKDSAGKVIEAISKVTPLVGPFEASLLLQRSSAVWNDEKVAEHYAILPTSCARPKELTDDERKIYELVVARYLTFFLPDHEFEQTKILTEIDHENFVATGKVVLVEGWKAVSGTSNAEGDSGAADGEEKEQVLPPVTEGDSGTATLGLLERKTKAPARFTEASLLAAMNGIHKFVSDPEIKKILKETDGIGTAATQGKILEELQQSGLFLKEKRSIISSPAARALIAALPERITLPDMTALWEQHFKALEAGTSDFDAVMATMTQEIVATINGAKAMTDPFLIPSTEAATTTKRPATMKGQKTSSVKPSKPKGSSKDPQCPKCGDLMRRRRSAKGEFWGCSKYPNCRGTLSI